MNWKWIILLTDNKKLYNLYSNTGLLLPALWSIVILERLIVTWLVEKCPTFYETKRYSKVFTTAHNISYPTFIK
jgi:hypothetical protein